MLGAPGAGKSTTLRRRTDLLARQALEDRTAPIPIFIRLGDWKDPDTTLATLIGSQAFEVAEGIAELTLSGGLAFLLDGLNELPAGDERMDKVRQLQVWIASLPARTQVTVSCRVDDYREGGLQLELDDLLTLQPLKPWRVREVLRRWITDRGGTVATADGLFWQMAGDPGLEGVLAAWIAAGSSEESFWAVTDPQHDERAYRKTSPSQDDLWRKHLAGRRDLVRLAENPFLLTMVFHVWRLHKERLPGNRTALVREFVNGLLLREGLMKLGARRGEPPQQTARSTAAIAGLKNLAWKMQKREDGEGPREGGGARTVATEQEALAALGGDGGLLKQVVDANLLDGSSQLRFMHQLLQEYFAALALDDRLEEHSAQEFWPADRWWERTGWEETAVLLAGLYPSDCTRVLEWLAKAQPEVAAQCALDASAEAPAEVRLRWAQHWQPLLTDSAAEPRPEARAALGRALGRLGLDERQGIGLKDGLPDILWKRIPEGDFVYQGGKEPARLDTFYIACYPITHGQFQAFLDAEDGHRQDQWWKGLTDPDRRPTTAAWTEPNSPRERVSWHEAMAFCGWLSKRLGFEVRLPTELEWERAARGTDGREYPWGDGYKPGFANINERIDKVGPHNLQRTSAVGIYPQGASAEGVMDLCGNVWEWCLNEHAKPERKQRTGTQPRVLRGGSWVSGRGFARAAYRSLGWRPLGRGYGIGFRVVCSSPIR